MEGIQRKVDWQDREKKEGILEPKAVLNLCPNARLFIGITLAWSIGVLCLNKNIDSKVGELYYLDAQVDESYM